MPESSAAAPDIDHLHHGQVTAGGCVVVGQVSPRVFGVSQDGLPSSFRWCMYGRLSSSSEAMDIV
jgi:hypothetical protein